MSSLVACAILMLAQTPAEPKLGPVLARLQDKDVKVRLEAVRSLSKWKTDLEPKAIAALANVIGDPDPRIRAAAMQTLGEVGPRAREWGGGPKFSAELAKYFYDKDTMTHRAAVWAYGQVGIDSAEELQPLYTVLQKSPSPHLRGLAVISLAQYVHPETTADWRINILDRIADCLADKDEKMQKLAGNVLVQGGVDSLAGLIRVLDTGKGTSRLWAALVLGEIGPAAASAIPSLERALVDVPKERRPLIQNAIKKIGS
jgi:HEAT repeat protein